MSSVSPTQSPTTLVYPSITFSHLCVGQRLDVSADGLIAVAVLSCTVGLTLWLLFAILRPRLRSIYALREWFVHHTVRPVPLPPSLLAFLNPKTPLFPGLPSDLSGVGRTNAEDARLFPSDEQLLQRFLWLAFVIATGWSIIGLGGALPIYLVNIPCYLTTGFFGGTTSILLELSILRLLRLFDTGHASERTLITHVQNAASDAWYARVRVIVTTVLALAGGLLPAVYLVLKEFGKLVEYRRQWIDVKCQNKELGWLSASCAPGFVGWTEKQMKQFVISSGLTSSLDATENSNRDRSMRRRGRRRRPPQEFTLNGIEEANSEVDIQMLFSIGDTQHLAVLINKRDIILENLEIAESKYITSFRTTTPDPSVLNFELTVPPPNPNRPYISLPQPLGTHRRRPQGRRAVNRALASSSLAPTSFVAPSQYYKLRSIHALDGQPTDSRASEKGRATSLRRIPEASFSDAFNSRIIGSRFFEVNRNSIINGRIPIGSPLSVDETGQLAPSAMRDEYSTSIPDPRLYGPNYVPETGSWDDRVAQKLGLQQRESYAGVSTETDESRDNGWVDIARTAPVDFGVDYYKIPENEQLEAGPSSHPSAALLTATPRRPRLSKPMPPIPPPESRRETFPLRQKQGPESVPPPHMRLQPSQPFVRPLDGVSFNELGDVYADITQWRSQLKAVNAEIEELQMDCYNDIADGSRIKGWLMVGRGLDYIPGVELIEGRAKEDIRWDVLQHEPFPLDAAVLWALIGVVIVLLAAGLTAASGLSLATAPDVAHFLPFLKPLLQSNALASGIATVLAPAIAIIVFVIAVLFVVDWATNVYGYISISASQLFAFKFMFFLTVMVIIWLTLNGAFLFSLQAFSIDETEAISVADGSISTSVLMLAIVTSFVVISPGLFLLQPRHMLQVIRAQRDAVTPRQRFRALYPLSYNPSFSLSACIFALIVASTFWLIFPLIGPIVAISLLLTLIAHRYLVEYVYARTHSQTGGLLQIWLLRRFGTVLSLQPILLGLIFLSRRLWIEGSVLLGTAVVLVLFVETYTKRKTSIKPRGALNLITQDSLNRFEKTATGASQIFLDGETTSGRGTRTRESMASVLDMMSITLAVSPAQFQGAVPLRTETIDDLTATERAARTHPDAPPHLPPLSFTEHADDMAGVLYAPELIAPPPIIWLPNDSSGIARSEAADLRKYHDLRATIDVRESGATHMPLVSLSGHH